VDSSREEVKSIVLLCENLEVEEHFFLAPPLLDFHHSKSDATDGQHHSTTGGLHVEAFWQSNDERSARPR